MVAVERTDLSKRAFFDVKCYKQYGYTIFYETFSVFDYFTVLEEVI